MSALTIETPEQMAERARRDMAAGSDPLVLLRVGVAWRDKWARLVEEQESGTQLDGRASIYTGETYAQARDRWDAYLLMLLEELRAPDGGLS